ncbi:hypothetical protein GR197_21050 [Rhizobium phaseoli]|uniref:Uncharacterized protein n=1 Tax=Rhizobium phaseoli TaxID=396 RepID=A0A7K3UH58_9HYPH|nr:hypothetical protein [Rhizobium phaseoli]NEJ72997.1 hypothetical protein [Rhizobium phaseoli]
MSDCRPEVEIDSFDTRKVLAPLLVDTPFRLIGRGFSKETIEVYVSTDEHGGDEVFKIAITDSSTSTDEVLSVVAKPPISAPTGTDLWVAIRLNGKFQDAQPGFKIV